VTTNEVPFERWLREPAKLVGWLVAATIAAAAVVLELANEVGVLLPDDWQDEIRVAVAVVTTVSLVATRMQAVLTRNGLGRPGRYFDGVYAPFTVQEAMKPSPEDVGPGGVGPAAITPHQGP
jgi:uncharacterized protein involved in response to NO